VTFQAGTAVVEIFGSQRELGEAAAERAAGIMAAAIRENGRARILVATGNSQLEFIDALAGHSNLDWKHVEVFHLDEYAGMSEAHPASFRRWIRTRLLERVHPGAAYLLQGDAADLDAQLREYAARLDAAPVDVAFVGIGENGHIAFNDPGVADFEDPFTVKRVVLDEPCRKQQVGEGHFPDLESVPKEAVTVTCPALLRARNWVSVVPERRKAEALRCSLEGPVSEACPGSLVRRHPNTFLYLDTESASLLEISRK
jgi:glucosamine-6-phosphate deaminase